MHVGKDNKNDDHQTNQEPVKIEQLKNLSHINNSNIFAVNNILTGQLF